MKTSQLIARLAEALAERGDQEVYLSNKSESVMLRQVSNEDSHCIWLRAYHQESPDERQVRGEA